MQLVRYSPHRNVSSSHNSLSDVFDGFFDDFFGPAFPTSNRLVKNVPTMKVDIFEKDEAYILEAEMAGVAKEDITIDVKGKTITVTGERKREEEVKKEHQIRMERSTGSFSRTFSMPFEIDSESVAARFENGILNLQIPKPVEKQRKRIEIK